MKTMQEITRVNVGNRVGFIYFNKESGMWHLKTLKDTFIGIMGVDKLIPDKIVDFASECGRAIQLTIFSDKCQILNPKW